MEVVGIGLLAFLFIAIAGLVVIFAVIKAVQSSLRNVANRAMERVLNVGERELVKGVQNIERAIGDEIAKNDPNRLATETMKLAEEKAGELTVSQVMSGLDVRQDVAVRTLEGIRKKSLCSVQDRNGQIVYIFPGFKKRKPVKICEYCGGTYEIREEEPLPSCPSCGAKLKAATVLE
ncbi:MAG: zinc ribbon domain-containing protein [Armatimonadetes bacterium]|nr:zinc ribbon domain-containing protein [Armatimonadota bacterium]